MLGLFGLCQHVPLTPFDTHSNLFGFVWIATSTGLSTCKGIATGWLLVTTTLTGLLAGDVGVGDRIGCSVGEDTNDSVSHHMGDNVGDGVGNCVGAGVSSGISAR